METTATLGPRMTRRVKGATAMPKENWISGAIKHPGALHKELGVPMGKKIPAGKLAAAKHSSNPVLRRRATLAATLRAMNRGK